MVSLNHNLIDLCLKGSNLLNSQEYLTSKYKFTGMQLRLIVINNTAEAGEVEQSIDLHWSISEDYDVNHEARLLRYGNAAEKTLINSTRYDLDNEGNYIEIAYSTYLDLQPLIRMRDGATGCADSQCNARFSKNNVLLDTYEWKKFMALETHMMNQFFMTHPKSIAF
ncbi:hypothetical protein FQA39_LY05035 [Lamprigera yunnana]|nr:hypothetical protein FQA39_LY05035 [Lamprigera yunnana]